MVSLSSPFSPSRFSCSANRILSDTRLIDTGLLRWESAETHLFRATSTRSVLSFSSGIILSQFATRDRVCFAHGLLMEKVLQHEEDVRHRC